MYPPLCWTALIPQSAQLPRPTTSRPTSTCPPFSSSFGSPPPPYIISTNSARLLAHDLTQRIQDLSIIKHNLHPPICNTSGRRSRSHVIDICVELQRVDLYWALWARAKGGVPRGNDIAGSGRGAGEERGAVRIQWRMNPDRRKDTRRGRKYSI
jgi:hypothetical protein